MRQAPSPVKHGFSKSGNPTLEAPMALSEKTTTSQELAKGFVNTTASIRRI
jgi:hypothetical protein